MTVFAAGPGYTRDLEALVIRAGVSDWAHTVFGRGTDHVGVLGASPVFHMRWAIYIEGKGKASITG